MGVVNNLATCLKNGFNINVGETTVHRSTFNYLRNYPEMLLDTLLNKVDLFSQLSGHKEPP